LSRWSHTDCRAAKGNLPTRFAVLRVQRYLALFKLNSIDLLLTDHEFIEAD
jgi:hypothetical protein